MKTTRYFKEQVLRKRPYLRREWCERALREHVKREIEPEGRVRYWYFVPELGKYLRVVTAGGWRDDSQRFSRPELSRG
jgi:acyl-coenzyme A synthetase/AMP-(fatty) acid ligase